MTSTFKFAVEVVQFQFHKVRLKDSHKKQASAQITIFQFHKVRLKVAPAELKQQGTLFQFHKVRLKVTPRVDYCQGNRISIP